MMHSRVYQEISTVLERLEHDTLLYNETHFLERMTALDSLETEVLDEIALADTSMLDAAERINFLERGEALQQKLEAANQKLFAHLVDRIRANDLDLLKAYFAKAAQYIAVQSNDDLVGYDEMDMLINGLLDVDLIPEESQTREAEMCFYQPTQGRIIHKLIEMIKPTAADVFYDLGSGLGHVPILVNLLTGAKTKGVEFDGAYIQYSEARVKKLGLSNVEFIQMDARNVDYSDGTIFYLYTPFRGELLRQVMTQLKAQSEKRSIMVCAYGPCTAEIISQQTWLQLTYQSGKHESHFGLFKSL